jgi:excisionase family DNA binding protein
MSDEMLRPRAVAAELDVPEHTLAQWRYQGTGPAFMKLGRHVRYRRSDLDDWLTSRTVAPRQAS